MVLNALRSGWSTYITQLRTRPFAVKACTTGCTFAFTDLLAQRQEMKKSQRASFDLARNARSGLFGALYLGPLNHVFWSMPTSRFCLEYYWPGASWRAVFTRVAVDQVTNMPLNMVMFLAWHPLLQGKPAEAASNVYKAFWPSYTFALSIWPWIHPLSFKYVPLEHRLLVLNFCSIGVFSYATWCRDRREAQEREAVMEQQSMETWSARSQN